MFKKWYSKIDLFTLENVLVCLVSLLIISVCIFRYSYYSMNKEKREVVEYTGTVSYVKEVKGDEGSSDYLSIRVNVDNGDKAKIEYYGDEIINIGDKINIYKAIGGSNYYPSIKDAQLEIESLLEGLVNIVFIIIFTLTFYSLFISVGAIVSSIVSTILRWRRRK